MFLGGREKNTPDTNPSRLHTLTKKSADKKLWNNEKSNYSFFVGN